MKQITAGITVLLVLLLGLVSCASAETMTLYVSPDGDYSIRAVRLTEAGRKQYLFLPGNADRAAWKIGFTGADSAELNGKPLEGGETAELLEEENTVVFNGRKKITFIVMTGSPDLPVLYIETQSGKLDKINHSKKNRESGSLYMVNGAGGTEYDGPLEYMKMRGEASTKYTKRNYQLKLEKGADLLGFGKAKKWILTGNWLDKSFIRNQMTYDLAGYMGLPWTPEQCQAEVYVNHEYLGLYLFSEKVEIQKNRIGVKDLEKATEELNGGDLSGYKRVRRKGKGNAAWKAWAIPENPADITGGYLIEYESQKSRYTTEPSGYETRRKMNLVIKSPEYASAEQAEYISAFMQGFENAIFAEDGRDPDTGKHYAEFVDMDSLVRKYMINEFSQNYDGNHSSEFFVKPSDAESAVAFAGPVWDMDNSYADFGQNYNRDEILSGRQLLIGKASSARYWWPHLYRQEDFREAIRETWTGLMKGAVRILLGEEKDPAGKLKSIDEYAAAIEKSAEMNFVRYPSMQYERSAISTGETLEENIRFLRSFIEKRTVFLEEAWFE